MKRCLLVDYTCTVSTWTGNPGMVQHFHRSRGSYISGALEFGHSVLAQ